MSAASKKSKTQQLKECWENGKLDCGAMTPEFIKGLSPRELGMLGELITIDYFNERGYTLLEQGYRCTEGEADLVLLDELDDVVEKDRQRRSRIASRLTVPHEYDSPLRSLRPCWTAILRILRVILIPTRRTS